MKCLLIPVFLFCSVFLFITSHAQNAKVKTKGSKTKIKETTTASTSNAATGTTSTSSGAGLRNTSWKAYIGDPLNDTLTLKYAVDSSFAMTRSGETVVMSLYTVSNDTLTINDVGGQYQCPGETGKYKFAINGSAMTLTLVEDGCQGRAAALHNTKWQKVNDVAAQ